METQNAESINNFYCALPWAHAVYQADGSIHPCCNFTLPTNFTPDAKDPDHLRDETRQAISSGQVPPGCERCQKAEQASGTSVRSKANQEFGPVWQQPPKLVSVEFNLGNRCNLICRGCNSKHSSRWRVIEEKLGIPPAPPRSQSLDALAPHWNTLREIKVIGGEPFLMPEHDRLLDELRRRDLLAMMKLSYSTNGTLRVSDSVLESWEKLRYLDISFSIDGYKEENDQFRNGSRWQDVLANLNWFREQLGNREPGSTMLRIHSVVSIENVHRIEQLDDWLCAEFPNFWLTKDCLIDPDWLCLRHLPDPERQQLVAHYNELVRRYEQNPKRRRGYQLIVHALEHLPAGHLGKFTSMNQRLNEARGGRAWIPNSGLMPVIDPQNGT